MRAISISPAQSGYGRQVRAFGKSAQQHGEHALAFASGDEVEKLVISVQSRAHRAVAVTAAHYDRDVGRESLYLLGQGETGDVLHKSRSEPDDGRVEVEYLSRRHRGKVSRVLTHPGNDSYIDPVPGRILLQRGHPEFWIGMQDPSEDPVPQAVEQPVLGDVAILRNPEFAVCRIDQEFGPAQTAVIGQRNWMPSLDSDRPEQAEW